MLDVDLTTHVDVHRFGTVPPVPAWHFMCKGPFAGLARGERREHHVRRPALRVVDAALLFVIVIWGFSPTIFKIALAELDPLAFAFLRFLLLAVISSLVLLWRSRHNPYLLSIDRRDVVYFVISGLSGYGIYQVLYMEGLAHTTVFASALLNATVPLWSVLILAVLRAESIHRMQWLGILVSLAGVAWFLLSAHSHQSELAADRTLTGSEVLLGNILTIVSSVLFALYGVTNKRLMRRYSATTLMCFTLIVGTLALAPFGVPALIHQRWQQVTWHAWVIVPYSAVVPIYVSYVIWNWAIAQTGVGYVTLFNYAVPVTGGIVGWVVAGEPLTTMQMAGGVLVLGGMLVARWGAQRVNDAHALPQRFVPVVRRSRDTEVHEMELHGGPGE